MDTSKSQRKKSQGWLTLKCSVILSYLVSIVSNVLLSIILFLSDHSYKWPGFVLHGLVLLCSLLSLRNVLNFNGKNIVKYRAMTKYYSINLIITGIFYIGVIIYSFIYKIDMDLIYYFTFCILVWCIFHGLFISIINSFIRTLEDRPQQKGTKVQLVDQTLQDKMLS